MSLQHIQHFIDLPIFRTLPARLRTQHSPTYAPMLISAWAVERPDTVWNNTYSQFRVEQSLLLVVIKFETVANSVQK